MDANKYTAVAEALKDLPIRALEQAPCDIRQLIQWLEIAADNSAIKSLGAPTPEEMEMVREGHTIAAIKSFRARTGCTLRHARLAIRGY